MVSKLFVLLALAVALPDDIELGLSAETFAAISPESLELLQFKQKPTEGAASGVAAETPEPNEAAEDAADEAEEPKKGKNRRKRICRKRCTRKFRRWFKRLVARAEAAEDAEEVTTTGFPSAMALLQQAPTPEEVEAAAATAGDDDMEEVEEEELGANGTKIRTHRVKCHCRRKWRKFTHAIVHARAVLHNTTEAPSSESSIPITGA
eukprot:g2718.t1